MSGENLGGRGAFVGGSYVEFLGQVKPPVMDESLTGKLNALMIGIKVQTYKAEAWEAARKANLKS